jgi:hypothetical protein
MEDNAPYGNSLIFVRISLRGYVNIKVQVIASFLFSGFLLGYLPVGLASESAEVVDQISADKKITIISINICKVNTLKCLMNLEHF